MRNFIRLFFLFIFSASVTVYAQDTVEVSVDLAQYDGKKLKVIVSPPRFHEEEVAYIIPQIVPGTYLGVNYVRFYSNMKAVDSLGNKLKVKRKGNHFVIKDAQKLYQLSYEVEQSTGDGRIWDNTVPCGGTIFKENSNFLLNYQLVCGYFQDHKDAVYQIELQKPKGFYTATSLTKLKESPTKDQIIAENYAALIDGPAMVSLADTTSFTVGNCQFHIAVFSENKIIKAAKLKPQLKELMEGVLGIMEKFPIENYHFLFYYAASEELEGGLLKSFGLGSALEHLHSSVYFMQERKDSSTLYVNYVAAHEFFHTWTPLTIHSQEIENFNFDTPVMSKQLWFYEGVTDYLASYTRTKYKIKSYSNLWQDLSSSIGTAEKMKARSMTKSSENIIKHNFFDWPSKIMQLSNFYEKGKLIAFALDMELMQRSDGKYRIYDLMKDLNKKYTLGKPFEDDKILSEMVNMTYPALDTFMNRFIVGKELVDYQKYLNLLGYRYIPNGKKLSSYGNLQYQFTNSSNKVYVQLAKKNTLGLMVGDTLLTINGDTNYLKRQDKNSYSFFYLVRPEKNESIELTVLRNGKTFQLKGKATLSEKQKHSVITLQRNPSPEQLKWRELYYNRVDNQLK